MLSPPCPQDMEQLGLFGSQNPIKAGRDDGLRAAAPIPASSTHLPSLEKPNPISPGGSSSLELSSGSSSSLLRAAKPGGWRSPGAAFQHLPVPTSHTPCKLELLGASWLELEANIALGVLPAQPPAAPGVLGSFCWMFLQTSSRGTARSCGRGGKNAGIAAAWIQEILVGISLETSGFEQLHNSLSPPGEIPAPGVPAASQAVGSSIRCFPAPFSVWKNFGMGLSCPSCGNRGRRESNREEQGRDRTME